MKNILGGLAAACIVLAMVPLGIVAIALLAAVTLAAIAYQVATGKPASVVEYERTVERTDETGRTTRRVFRSTNGITEMTEEVVK